MKLNGLPKRAYNILFHTHMVAGIVISFGLFIIFYTGSFALFRYEMYKWENPAARYEAPTSIDFDHTLEVIRANNAQFAEEEQFTIRLPDEEQPFIQFFGAEHTDHDHPERFHALINTANDYEVTNLENPITTVGDTLYHLHYFDQIPFGIYISGFVAVFFLFATVTGILIHWKNIVNKFYAFITQGKWKQIWTNAHTTLGVIGLPFQVVYAVTGALFGLLTLLLVPSAFVLFGGDTNQVLATVRPESAITVDKNAATAEHASLEKYYKQVREMYPDIPIDFVTTRNHGRADGLASYYLDDERTINGTGQVTFNLNTGEIVSQTDPADKAYTVSVLSALTKLHFATFGGLLLKIAYFILGMITCFMILSGVLLWQQARNNKRYTAKQKRFHHRVTKVYLAICLGLFPATAILFLANKFVPMDLVGRTFYVNSAFFLSWLLLILIGLFWNNFRRLNKNYLLLGGLLSLFIPIANGIMTGDWLWKTLATGEFYVASVDIFWLFTGITALGVLFLIPKQISQENVEITIVEPSAVTA